MPRPKGLPKTGGRRKGSLDKARRNEVTEEVAFDILSVYRGLGGVAWLMEWAEKNPSQFISQALARLMPAMPRDEAEVVNNTQINIGSLDQRAIATRIAYALNAGLQTVETSQPTAAGPPRTLEEAALPMVPEPDSLEPLSIPSSPFEREAERAAWKAELEKTEGQREIERTNALTLETLPGSAAEQGRRRRLL